MTKCKESAANVNKDLEQEVHKPMIKKFKRKKVCEVLRQYLANRFNWNGIIIFLELRCYIFIMCDRCFHQIYLGQTFEG